MDMKDIRRIIELMKQNDLAEFELEEEDFRLALRRRSDAESEMLAAVQAAPAVAVPAAPPAAAPAAAPPAADSENDGLVPIKSPMVGTFYRSPSPDADTFIAAGATVDDDSVVCIIEAMKVMNEIKAETRGTVKKILVENASPVQFGQPLFLVEPA